MDVFEGEREKKSDPAKIMCYCDNFPTVCELDMDLYFNTFFNILNINPAAVTE